MIYGLIGEKLAHSRSKEIHSELGRREYEYYELTPHQVEAFVKQDCVGGLNVTIPYKRLVMPFCDTLSPSAERIGSVNTLVRDAKGSLCGYNTDYDGFVYMVKKAGIEVAGKKVMILGTGGTSLTAQAVVEDMGAAEVAVVSRRGAERISDDDLAKNAESQIIINTTPVGMYPETSARLLDLKAFPCCIGVVDVIYNPCRTGLMLQARDLGIPAAGGLSMLVVQARVAEEIFGGEQLADSSVERIISKIQKSEENIVIIGMPGSGKTSVGTAVAGKLKREFVDIDVVIEAEERLTVPEIFQRQGEEAFRRLEAAMIERQGKRNGIVIATGGGAVLAEKNYQPLAQNGCIFRLERKLSKLATEGRPLSKSQEVIREMYAVRLPLYQRFADKVVQNETTIAAAADEVIRLFT